MAVYEINGSRYEIPDEVQGDELTQTLTYLSELPQEGQPQDQEAPQPQGQEAEGFQGLYGKPAEDIDPATLMDNPEWLMAVSEVYRMNEGQDFNGDAADLTEYGLDFMGFFNYNLPKMGLDAARVAKADQNQKEAFLYMMDTYDNLNMSWGGTGRFFKGVLTDPTTYIGLGTLGIGFLGKEASKQVGKQTLKETLKQSLGRTGIVAGVEGAIYGGADNTIRQSVEVSAGRKEEIDYLEAAGAVGLGAAIGVVGGTVIDAAATGIQRSFRGLRGDDLPVARSEPTAQPKVDPEQPNVPAPKGETPGEAPGTPASRAGDEPNNQLELGEDAPGTPPREGTELELLETPSASREVGTEGAIRIEVDDIIDHRRLNKMAPSRVLQNPLPFVPRNMEEITKFAEALGRNLQNLHFTQAQDIVRDLKDTKMTLAEFGDFIRSTQIAKDGILVEQAGLIKQIQKTTDPQKMAELSQRVDTLEKQLEPVAMMDEALSSMTGSTLRQRQEGLDGVRGLSIKNLMEKEGMTRAEAEAAFVDRVEKAVQSKAGQEASRMYDQKIDDALALGDTKEAARWTTLRRMHVEALSRGDVRMIHKLNELVISNVFSATTVAVNVVPSGIKTVYKPALKALLSNPLEAATRREMMATYSAMRTNIGAAWRAAKAAFRYEQSILTRDAARLTEGELAITGRKAEFIRIFPRILNATDEFLARINYSGFVAGDAAARAYESGVEQGLKGKALDDFIKERVQKAMDESLSSGEDEAAFAVLLNKGVNLGLKGDDLINYVQKEIARDPSALRHGTNKEAVNYARDILFKRAFSGTNGASFIAKKYEEVVNRAPVLRLMGQLFFRTPVRVFEEGIRLTPGVQFIHPTFMKDLRGANGRARQVRAQGEALMSLAFTGTVLSLFAQGKSPARELTATGSRNVPG